MFSKNTNKKVKYVMFIILYYIPEAIITVICHQMKVLGPEISILIISSSLLNNQPTDDGQTN